MTRQKLPCVRHAPSLSNDAQLGCHGVSHVSEFSFPGSHPNPSRVLRLYTSDSGLHLQNFHAEGIFCLLGSVYRGVVC